MQFKEASRSLPLQGPAPGTYNQYPYVPRVHAHLLSGTAANLQCYSPRGHPAWNEDPRHDPLPLYQFSHTLAHARGAQSPNATAAAAGVGNAETCPRRGLRPWLLRRLVMASVVPFI